MVVVVVSFFCCKQSKRPRVVLVLVDVLSREGCCCFFFQEAKSNNVATPNQSVVPWRGGLWLLLLRLIRLRVVVARQQAKRGNRCIKKKKTNVAIKPRKTEAKKAQRYLPQHGCGGLTLKHVMKGRAECRGLLQDEMSMASAKGNGRRRE